MAYRTKLLVVANQTVDSEELHSALCERAERGPISVLLVVPQDAHAGMHRRLQTALQRLHDAGIEAEGVFGDSDPCVAAAEAWDPRRFDEIVVSTLPPGISRWLAIDLPRRVARTIDAPVSQVVARPQRAPTAAAPVG